MSSTPFPLKNAPAWAPAWLGNPRFSLYLTLAVVVVAFFVGWNTPTMFPLSFLEEDGPVENGTVVLYLLAPLFLFLRTPGLSRLDKLAITIMLLTFAAREADLHKAMFGMSILKARFYNQYATGLQIAEALGVLAPIAASVLWLAKRHLPRWLASPSQWSPALRTVTTFALVMVVSKVMDRLPDNLVTSGIYTDLPLALRYLLLGLEEILEMLLPVLAIVAMLQAALFAQAPRLLPGTDRRWNHMA